MIFGKERYHKFSILLHWVVALIVLTLIALGMYMHDLPKGHPDRAFFFNLHKSLGLTAGILMLVRLWWRHKNPPPALPSSIPRWQGFMSRLSHGLLYICLISMPVVGFSASQFTKYGVTYFGLFKIPPMGPNDPVVRDFLQSIHHDLAFVLMVLVGIHVLAAMFHWLVLRDDVIKRMLP
jgi:cytochrome b561